jgi:hypothetical protein
MSDVNTNVKPSELNRPRFGYRDGVLTAIAALLALNLLKGGDATGLPGAREALAQRAAPEAYGVPNASEQRARMIRVMEDMSAKVQSLAQTIEKGGFKVEVTAMPKVELAQ